MNFRLAVGTNQAVDVGEALDLDAVRDVFDGAITKCDGVAHGFEPVELDR